MSDGEPVPAILRVVPWRDEVVDRLGHDPRSAYVERFWLGILGPSTTWLLRRLAVGLERSPDGLELDLADTARRLGLGDRGGAHSPFMRAVGRCCQFHLAQRSGQTLAVRRRIPPLTRGQVLRLAPDLQVEHLEWQESQLRVDHGHDTERARGVALSLVALGEDRDSTEWHLQRWRFPTTVSAAAAQWAWDREHAATPPTDAA